MKIAIDIRTAGGEKAGKGWYTFHIVKSLLEQDSSNQYILYSKDGVPGFDQFKNVIQKQISGYGVLWHKNVVRDTKKEKVDLFFAPSSFIVPAWLPKTIKTIITVHDLVAFLYPTNHNKKAVIIEKVFLKKALKKADHVITVSNNTKKDLYQKFKYNKDQISTIYCSASDDFRPVPKEELTAFTKKTNLPKNFFLAVGTIEPRKNYPNLIRAFAQISEKYPDHHLIIVGKDGWKSEKVHEEIKKNYLQKKVHILGYLSGDSLTSLFNLAKAFVFPSFYEGFGIPPLEAMKCGCPVIASNTSSIPEVVGDSALLVNPEKIEEISGAMEKIIKDPELRDKLKNKGLNQSKKFSWEESAAGLLKIINDVIIQTP